MCAEEIFLSISIFKVCSKLLIEIQRKCQPFKHFHIRAGEIVQWTERMNQEAWILHWATHGHQAFLRVIPQKSSPQALMGVEQKHNVSFHSSFKSYWEKKKRDNKLCV